MRQVFSIERSRRGITVLGLLLLIIALVIAAVLLIRYLRDRPAAASSAAVSVIPSEARNRVA